MKNVLHKQSILLFLIFSTVTLNVFSQNYYQILNISQNATQSEIKKAYRKKALQTHPDRGGSEAVFKKVGQAYSVLSDPDKKSVYDRNLPQGHQAAEQAIQEYEKLAGQVQRAKKRQEEREKAEQQIQREKAEKLQNILNQAEYADAATAHGLYGDYLQMIYPLSTEPTRLVEQAADVIRVYHKLIAKYLDENNQAKAIEMSQHALNELDTLQKNINDLTHSDKDRQKPFIEEVKQLHAVIVPLKYTTILFEKIKAAEEKRFNNTMLTGRMMPLITPGNPMYHSMPNAIKHYQDYLDHAYPVAIERPEHLAKQAAWYIQVLTALLSLTESIQRATGLGDDPEKAAREHSQRYVAVAETQSKQLQELVNKHVPARLQQEFRRELATLQQAIETEKRRYGPQQKAPLVQALDQLTTALSGLQAAL